MLIIFSNLDGCLLNQENEDYKLIIPVIEKLKAQGIPLITVTSKTCAEVADLRETLGLNDPFIVENGSAIFIPQGDLRWQTDETTLESDYYVKTLGCTYIEARAGLKIIQSTLRINNLKGFGDFEDTEIQSLTGLSRTVARKAKTREFSEPFIPPKDISTVDLENAAAEFGFRVLFGAPQSELQKKRLYYLVGINASTGRAVQWLRNHYQPETVPDKIVTIGLGNSSQDLTMLEKMDIPVVIPSTTGIDPSLVSKGWKTSKSPDYQGWVEAITEICQLQMKK